MALPALHLRLKDVANIGACEGYEQEPTTMLVKAIYACMEDQVIPLMEGLGRTILKFKSVELHDTWIGKSICLLFSCRLVLSMTNVVVRPWYSGIIEEAFTEMQKHWMPRLEFESARHFVVFVTTVEAVLFKYGRFQYICNPLNRLQRFGTLEGKYPICTNVAFLKDMLFERKDCHFTNPGKYQQKITRTEICTLLDDLRALTAQDLTKYEPDPKRPNPLGSGVFGQVYTRLLPRRTPTSKQERVAEKVIQTPVAEYDVGLSDEHVREIVILNMEKVRACKFIAILLEVIVDPYNEEIHLYMPWRLDLYNFMNTEYKGITKPRNVVQSVTGQMLSALHVLYDLNVAHRDLKMENILVSYDRFLADGGTAIGERWIEITDFGKARQIDPGMKNTGTPRDDYGSLWCRSPEALAVYDVKYERIEQAGDVWSAGCILYEVATGTPALSENTVRDMLKRILTFLNIQVDEAAWNKDDHPLNGIFVSAQLQPLNYDSATTLESLLREARSSRMLDDGDEYLGNLVLAIRAMLELDSTKRPTAAELLPGGLRPLALLREFDPATTYF